VKIPKIKWETNTRKYGSGEWARVGKWVVGAYYWDAGRSTRDDKAYRATCYLPGIKDDLGNYETVEQAKARVQSAIKHWFQAIG